MATGVDRPRPDPRVQTGPLAELGLSFLKQGLPADRLSRANEGVLTAVEATPLLVLAHGVTLGALLPPEQATAALQALHATFVRDVPWAQGAL